ncbi:MAG: hypothetical protein IJ124_11655 [Clostridia bacterium]|nr:hypothetical protein [Clostridia bacterium]
MADTMVKINVEEIMQEIRAEIKREHADDVDIRQVMRELRAQADGAAREPVPPFNEIQNANPPAVPSGASLPSLQAAGTNREVANQITNEAQYLKGAHYIPYYRDLGKGPKAFAKRIIRKLNRCNVLPINEQQNDFNLHTANGVDALRTGLESLQITINANIELQNSFNRQLAGNVDALRAGFEGLQNAINAIHRRLDTAEGQLQAIGRGLDEQREALDRRLDEQREALDRSLDEQRKAIELKLDDARETMEGQWSAIEMLQEQTDGLDIQPIEARVRKFERCLEEMQKRIEEHELAIRKQRQEQFVTGDRLRALQDKLR